MLKFSDLYVANDAWEVDSMLKIFLGLGDERVMEAHDANKEFGEWTVDWFNCNTVGIVLEDD